MSLIKIIRDTLIISITALVLLFILFEVYIFYNKEKYPSYGWYGDNKMIDKIYECNKNSKKKKIGVFGDSLVEYFGKSSENLVQQISIKFDKHKVCNFGISGHGITVYINRFLSSLENNNNFDKIIFYFFEGNDFSSFRYLRNSEDFYNHKLGYINGIYNYNSVYTGDRENNFFKNIVKSTHTLNIIYREFVKKYFFSNRINESFVKEIFKSDKYKEDTLENAIIRMNNMPNELKKKFSSNLLNINLFELALTNPNYYSEIHDPKEDDFLLQKRIASHHIDFINSLCKKNKIDCFFITIPTPVFLFKESKGTWKNLYRFNNVSNYGPSEIVKYLNLKYRNFHYAGNIFFYSDYIKDDLHLNGKGNKKLAEFTYKSLN